MKKLKKIFIITTLLFIALILLLNSEVLANDITNNFQVVEYSEEYQRWLELPEEEREKVMQPRMYDVPNTRATSSNLLYRFRLLGASANSRYSLKDVIPANVIIKNQQSTNSCWTFAGLSSLETNLALYNYKRGINTAKIYDYSERHMEYATSRTFANDVINEMGYNRNVGDGGNWYYIQSYLTNGSGAINETEMPFEDNENIISISEIQNKTVTSQVYDTVDFVNYNKLTDETEKEAVKNQIKQHIQNYGSVVASIHGEETSTTGLSCYNNDTGAKYCNNTILHSSDHAVSIIGWDDNYSVDNFVEGAKPSSNGAWIIRNSWGEEVGDNGLIYVSYEDCNISSSLYGIVKAADNVNYENIYQYDEYYPTSGISANSSTVMLCNIFNKKTNGTEYLSQVSLYAPETYTCKVYVNPNGAGYATSDMQQVTLKAGESETFNAGYHTLEFATPIEIKADSFAVIVEIESSRSNSTYVSIESKIEDTPFETITVESEKCFVTMGNDLDNCEWTDLGKFSQLNSSLPDGDSTIKAFTSSEILDDSLKSIEIVTPPNKTSYFEGENFDKTGMVVQANFNNKTSGILDDSNYSITNGTNLKAGQASVTITYDGKSVEQAISVEKNSVAQLNITTPPTKTTYKEGESFDKTGMVVEATYKNGDTRTISDYTIEGGNNVENGQTQVTISYEGISINQEITVIPNPLIEINVANEPDKLNYIVGQNFDKTGMVINGTYQDGSIYEIAEYTIENGTNLTKEQTYVTIKYKEKSTTQAITVEEKSVTQISIDKSPSKLTYIQNKEEIDLTGGTLNITYNDGTIENISMASDGVEVTGFDNKNLGKVTITVKYESKTAQFEVEIIEEEKAENSNLDNAKCTVTKVQAYYNTDNSKQEYMVINIEINEISRNLNNDTVEYYYYLSSNADEENINNWVKITEVQNSNNKLQFTIDSRDVSNYAEISSGDVVYLYVKEVAIKGGDQSVAITEPMKIETDISIETYVDNKKVEISEYGSGKSGEEDNTTAPGTLPQTGIQITVIVLIVVMLGVGIFVYVKYRKLSKDMK